ncbi:3-oxoacyl-[acyl-carrier-protein] synthase III C-terminal domain-containing protein [Novosphingobium sp. 9U]|uniref:3-oxoacyl-[acyl-carrier-protein] synthase III C-terminal domain-containing protein n=1 Tax=Novosphingobium sp. 9U TaxID=2653158 RepID=UPI0012EF406D|nr:3-oxoacyl-[acyl-carrier-protein] synthase III C-terminal domain-containing protein [Novosphingobium sp. 9U]VWX50189.1 Hydroxymethylglutaryl-CoA synthase [Novosphingobium sp. 9U]
MSDFGITAFGAYVPRLRLDRGAIAAAHKWMAPSLKGLAKGSRAFCNWDEDTITMAVEAGRDALRDRDRSTLTALGFASTRAPYADLQASAIIGGALDLPHTVRTIDSGLGQRAGTSGLLAALKTGEPSLFIASDAPLGRPASTQEIGYGAGAAAFVLGTENVAARLVGAGSVAATFVSHFRDEGESFEYHWEERWVRDEGYAKLVPPAVKAALEQAGIGIAEVTHLAMPSPLRNIAVATAKQIGFAGEQVDNLDDGCGYAGSAHATLMLARALETAEAGDRVLVISFGQGVDALVFEVTEAITQARPERGVAGSLANGLMTDSYLRMLSFQGGIEPEWGMRAEKSAKTALTEQYRTADQVEGFKAGHCGECGTIQFPQLQYCVNCHAPKEQFDSVSLIDQPAKVMTHTADWLSYYPSPPLHGGFVQFDNGARLQMEMVDVGPEGLELGASLEMVFRVKEQDRQRGYNRYFWKAVPKLGGEKD